MRCTGIAALALLAAAAGCGNHPPAPAAAASTTAASTAAPSATAGSTTSGADTPLEGTWQSVQAACETTTQIRFERGRYSSFESPDGIYPGWTSIEVHYVSSPEEVWIVGSQYGSNQTRVFVIDANHIRPDDARNCIFQRVG